MHNSFSIRLFFLCYAARDWCALQAPNCCALQAPNCCFLMLCWVEIDAQSEHQIAVLFEHPIVVFLRPLLCGDRCTNSSTQLLFFLDFVVWRLMCTSSTQLLFSLDFCYVEIDAKIPARNCCFSYTSLCGGLCTWWGWLVPPQFGSGILSSTKNRWESKSRESNMTVTSYVVSSALTAGRLIPSTTITLFPRFSAVTYVYLRESVFLKRSSTWRDQSQKKERKKCQYCGLWKAWI